MKAPDRGSIVQATVLDPGGRNPKSRPLVLVSLVAELAAGEPHLAVAITGSLSKPLAEDEVALPWQRAGHPKTGLSKRCGAKCSWIVEVTDAQIESVNGRVPDRQLWMILEKLEKYKNPPPDPPSSPPA